MDFAKNLLLGIVSALSQQGFLKLSKRRVPSYCEEETEEKDRKKRRVEPIATPRKDKALSLADTANPHLPRLRTSAPGRNSDPGRAQRSYDASRHTHAFESGGFSFCAPPLERPREKENDHPEAHRFSDSANTRSIAGQRNRLAGPFVGSQPFIFSGRSSLTEITAIPRGLLNPDQLRVADEIAKTQRAKEGHATLRQKASFPLQFPADTILPHTSYSNNNEDVQMIGESNVQSHAAREQDSKKRAQLLLEKERRAAENARDEEQERRKAHDETIQRFEATDGPSLLVKTALLETDNTDLKAKLQQKSTELEDSLQKLEDLRLENLKLKEKAQTSRHPSPKQLAHEGVDQELLSKIMQNFRPNDQLVEKFDIDITQKKIDCMRDGQWLNSEVITWWLEWWRERTGGGSQKLMPVKMEGISKNWFANTYFYTKLMEDGAYSYKNVKRWTKKINIFECDKMIIPINSDNTHWYLACINFKEKRTEVYDSLGGHHDEVHEALLRWLRDEHQDKRGQPLPDTWTKWRASENGVLVPRQCNSVDCGVFCCLFAACVSLDCIPFDFSQSDIALIRRWMVQVIYKEGEKEGNCAVQGLCSV